MKKLFSIFLIATAVFANAQDSKETANRFFYELNFKPKKDSAKVEKVITILDITDKNRSVYQDYTVISQDSIMKVEIEAMQKSGQMKDLSKLIKMPKISARVYKTYPTMKIQFVEKITSGFTPANIGYVEDSKFNWKILSDKQKIGEYNTQKATTEYGGRKWTAWFSTDIPFQDGPYKFSGLPGLIVKIEDDAKNYSWVLQGNKKVQDYTEYSYIEGMMQAKGGKVSEMPRDKFEKKFTEFKKDPFATLRPMLTPEITSRAIPGMDGTVGDMIKKQEKQYKDFFKATDNEIEPDYGNLTVGEVERTGTEKIKK
ncbi:GLPGLI family protein [Chryseobacterium piscicola]|jgi:GLPGLI family protein|uniref:GLPGLI family protein n=1 Tax=Chryseobacterium piscicola TaxID=551459 RepID=A0A1N7JUD2_9FLAO|nr:GLPGLI family protein [Chryseobacterium piscicola]PQA91272.1 GLPGLI family protein [Chryseobacterium piscicola]SIS52959.1 GLPGLI family protein [Chryseobacterium piscicola]